MTNSRKALVVGIDEYPVNSLRGCVNDAKDIAALLSRDADLSVNFSVQLKTSENFDIDKPTLKKWIAECFKGDDEVALFYFSGHGQIDEKGGYIVTPDYSPGDWGISMEEILTIANNSECQNKVIILDCCHSGSVGAINTMGQKTAVIKEGVTILTASKFDETAAEINGHGVFTALLTDALKGGAADITGNISPGSIYAYIDRALGPWQQRPVFKTNVKSFVSLRKSAAPIDISVVRKITEYFSAPNIKLPLNPSFEPTNNKSTPHKVVKPYSDEDNVAVFADLQKLEGVGLVVPDGEEHMYYAAMNSKSCRLTSIGQHYWRLVKEGRI
ncbi:MAG: caspase family protein [Clostridia bacterium]|nr:caspase family protein [Clostridia bacterium]